LLKFLFPIETLKPRLKSLCRPFGMSVRSFISKNLVNTELMWIRNDKKIISLEKRKHTEAIKFMTEFLKKNILTDIPKGLQSDFKRGFKVSIGNKNLSKSIKEAASELISTDGALLHFN